MTEAVDRALSRQIKNWDELPCGVFEDTDSNLLILFEDGRFVVLHSTGGEYPDIELSDDSANPHLLCQADLITIGELDEYELERNRRDNERWRKQQMTRLASMIAEYPEEAKRIIGG